MVKPGVVEFYNASLDHFFITANPAERKAIVDGAVYVTSPANADKLEKERRLREAEERKAGPQEPTRPPLKGAAQATRLHGCPFEGGAVNPLIRR